jgi:hypothetical protein
MKYSYEVRYDHPSWPMLIAPAQSITLSRKRVNSELGADLRSLGMVLAWPPLGVERGTSCHLQVLPYNGKTTSSPSPSPSPPVTSVLGAHSHSLPFLTSIFSSDVAFGVWKTALAWGWMHSTSSFWPSFGCPVSRDRIVYLELYHTNIVLPSASLASCLRLQLWFVHQLWFGL